MAAADNRDTRQGFFLAGAAYLLWGFLPLYMKAMAHIPALEIVPHRILWSIPVVGLIVWWQGVASSVLQALRTPRVLLMALLTASLISVNWLTYVWAIGAGRALETALGYYINPLFSIFLAAVLIGERLRPAQMAAIALAAVGVGVMTWEAGGVPWVSIVLTVTWGFYAYFKRTLPVGATEGFFLEIIILALPAAALWLWFAQTGSSHFGATGWADVALLSGTGVVTGVPLVLYANGAKGLRLSTIALMQYSAPTMIFLTAVFLFHESFSREKMVAFGFIWLALAVYTWSLLKGSRAAQRDAGR
jgi:chloramphenicol-sensitive protein RarD